MNRLLVLALGLVMGNALTACKSAAPVSSSDPSDWTCPPGIAQQIRLAVSVVPRPLTPDMAVNEGATRIESALARTVVVSVEPISQVNGARMCVRRSGI